MRPFLAFCLILCLFTALPACAAVNPELPALRWQERSDWTNVKRDVTPRAIGDGRADDTAAIQAGLDKLSESTGQSSTLYLPPGVYRITRTLFINKRDGISVVGCGRLTRIVWDGGTGPDARMFVSNGAPRAHYIGLTWDGKGKAAVGFDHASKNYFETEIDHQCEAFLNFTESGARAGYNQTGPGAQATAETTWENCLFIHCARGLSLLAFNVYDHTIAGSDFIDCGTGIYASAGPNFYVRDCRFERSRDMDVQASGEHGISLRRCVSTGSRMFVSQATIAPLTVDGCRITRWTNSAGAVTLGGGPALVFDCVFSAPPSRQPPIVPGEDQQVVISNVRSDGTDGVFKPGLSRNVALVRRGSTDAGVVQPSQTFFQPEMDASARVFDAKRQFGAKGDGRADDTAAVTATIEAARRYGKGAVAYFPSGDYLITRPIAISGRDYAVAGCGIRSRWIGKDLPDGMLVHVVDPQNIVVAGLMINCQANRDGSIDILQTGGPAPSHIRYERVYVTGIYSKKPLVGGLVFRDLPRDSVVIGDHVQGNLRFENSSRATFLFNVTYEGSITVGGAAERIRDGFLGFMTRLGTMNVFGVDVHDSQNLVMSDYYVEQADRLMRFSGSPGDPEGHVTISMPKTHSNINPVIEVSDYHGRVAIGPAMFYPGGINPAVITHTGTNPFALALFALQDYNLHPKIEMSAPARWAVLGIAGEAVDAPASTADANTLVVSALDDLRSLGDLDLRLNYAREARPRAVY